MGKNNRQRRATKAKARDQTRRQHHPYNQYNQDTRPGADQGPGPAAGDQSPRQRVAALYALNRRARDGDHAEEIAATVDQLSRCAPDLVAQELEQSLARILATLWASGWLPGEVIRQARRATSAAGERLATWAVAADHLSRPPAALHPRWVHHVDQLALPAAGPQGWLRRFHHLEQAQSPLAWPTVIDLASSLAHTLIRLGRISEIIPPPGSPGATSSIVDLAARTANPVLTRVRQLLAQAESTSFDAEAEAFTAKAQELMARYAIDAAVVWDRHRQEKPLTVRVPIDEPYVDAKNLLVTVVADESQCRAVIDPYHGLASLIGFENDLVWCETLYTSLLIQAQRELTRAGAGDRAGGRRRSRSFRASFLFAYATRIGERLAEVNAHVRGTAETEFHPAGSPPDGNTGPGGGLLPVLARRRSAVDDEINAQFGTLGSTTIRSGSDQLGWNAGRQAADRADLARGDLEARAS